MGLEVRGMTPHLAVFDMPTSLKFYRDALGFEIAASSGNPPDCGWVMLKRDGVELMLNTAYDEGERPERMDSSRIGAHEDTTLYFACPDVDGAYEHLKAAGLPVKAPEVAWYGMRQLYFTDPDGYLLCLQSAVKK
jgi:glyoxylase I family protein